MSAPTDINGIDIDTHDVNFVPELSKPLDEVEVIQLVDSAEEKTEMKPLFSVNGKTYKIPGTVRPNVSLQILAKVQEQGAVFGEIYMLRTVLGTAAFDALLGSPGLSEDNMKVITRRVQKVVFGSTEDEGNG